MANLPYDNAYDMALDAGFDWVDGDYLVVGCTDAYTFDAGHVFRSELAGVIDTASVTGKTSTAGVADAADVVGVGGLLIPSGSTMERLILCTDTGSPSTDKLVFYWDENGDGTPIYRPGDDTVAPVIWSSGIDRVFSVRAG